MKLIELCFYDYTDFLCRQDWGRQETEHPWYDFVLPHYFDIDALIQKRCRSAIWNSPLDWLWDFEEAVEKDLWSKEMEKVLESDTCNAGVRQLNRRYWESQE